MQTQNKHVTERATLFNKLRSLSIKSIVVYYWHDNNQPCLLAPLYNSDVTDTYMISANFNIEETKLIWSIARNLLPDNSQEGHITIIV
ncbi:MAG: hypothetical protein IM507_01635 [Microcystis sp. M20BS1]|uniref:hypothetical protein n=1 Tax=Microcystis sp. M20BS1 TaxID=2771181 RepID=UPI002579BFB9|nr:hypothetical protein [Microcystis sp. M20BS1]MCA2631139.1 hypothetical protein [Microcystis sp. M20BS1]